MVELTPEKALIFRITHIDNVAWVLANGLHCCTSDRQDPNFRAIGNPDLIRKRTPNPVRVPPGGTLGDYVPFYFTPRSVMLLNIKTGWYGMRKTPMPDIAFFITSLHALRKRGVPFLFTDRHAYIRAARYSDDLDNLTWIDWEILNKSDFRKNDTDDPGKCERYQAEALVHRLLPASALMGIGCYGTDQLNRLEGEVANHGLKTAVVKRPGWYF